ncbi:bacteriocin-type signal sequence domain protein [Desulfosporosinus sp. OT]|nr:bacteriocin-type signal sequence domain protein [Desulfosporosinus sp. OT]
MKNAMILSDLNYTELTTEELNTINGGRHFYRRHWIRPHLNSSFYKTKKIISRTSNAISNSGGGKFIGNLIKLARPLL